MEKATENILHCNHSVDFFISWTDDGLISVGEGQCGATPFMEWQDPDPVDKNGVGFATAAYYSAHWFLDMEQGEFIIHMCSRSDWVSLFKFSMVVLLTLTGYDNFHLVTLIPVHVYMFLYVTENVIAVKTENSGTHDKFWISAYHRGYLVFKVKTCGLALIALSPIEGLVTVDTCEVTLGASQNTKSTIKCGSLSETSADTPDIVNCHEDRPFWVSWETEAIRVGYGGHVYQDEFMKLDYTTAQMKLIGGVSFASSDSEGVWTVHKPSGKCFVLSKLNFFLFYLILITQGSLHCRPSSSSVHNRRVWLQLCVAPCQPSPVRIQGKGMQ